MSTKRPEVEITIEEWLHYTYCSESLLNFVAVREEQPFDEETEEEEGGGGGGGGEEEEEEEEGKEEEEGEEEEEEEDEEGRVGKG